jgi:hypothetical protein
MGEKGMETQATPGASAALTGQTLAQGASPAGMSAMRGAATVAGGLPQAGGGSSGSGSPSPAGQAEKAMTDLPPSG